MILTLTTKTIWKIEINLNYQQTEKTRNNDYTKLEEKKYLNFSLKKTVCNVLVHFIFMTRCDQFLPIRTNYHQLRPVITS